MNDTPVLRHDTVSYDEGHRALVIIDQTRLPHEEVLLTLTTLDDIVGAIQRLQVRGAPAIGVAAAIGLYVVASRLPNGDPNRFFEAVRDCAATLHAARPTAVNLRWAISRMGVALLLHRGDGVQAMLSALRETALRIRDEDIQVCRAIGRHGLTLLHDGDGILTHCNAGQLAAVRYGTALAPIYLGQEEGMRFHVYADETRPLLQGARLTAYELCRSGVDTTIICDNMAASVLKSGRVNAVIVGCDRVAMNGDFANKIGTSGLAILAGYYGVPFYVCAPTSTIDHKIEAGNLIPIEQRSPTEVSSLWYRREMTPAQAHIENPAFDVTDHSLVTAFVTEYGIIRPPYLPQLKALFASPALKNSRNPLKDTP